jgi:hypothetical protein
VVVAMAIAPLRAILATPNDISILPSLQVDSAAYDQIARAIAGTWSLREIPPLQPPGFVTTIAAVYAFAGPSWLAAKVFLWAMFVLCVVLAARLGAKVGGSELAAWLAALLTGSSTALALYTGTIQYEVLAAAWLLGLLLIADWSGRAGDLSAALRRALLLGVLAGAAALTREVLVVCVPLLAAFVFQRLRDALPAGPSAMIAVMVVLTAATMVTGWAGFQSARTHRVIAMTDKGPAVLAFGNNPHANGTFNAPAVGVGEPSGFAFMQAHPRATLRLAGRKVLYFCGILRDGWNVPRRGAIWLARATAGLMPLEIASAVARGGALAVVFIIAVGLWTGETRRRWWVLPAIIAAIMFVHVLTVSSHRFAVPVLPLAFVCIAGPAATVIGWSVRRLRVLTAVALLVLVTTSLQTAAWPMSYTLRASEMDGLDVANVIDEERGVVRFAEAGRGRRAMALLTDEYLPRGRFTITVDWRQRTASGASVARIGVRTTDGRPLCEFDVPGGPDAIGRWQKASLACASASDHVSTLAVESTGAADLDVESVVLEWHTPR